MLIICKIVNIIPKINLFSICLNNNTGLKFMLFVCCKPLGQGNVQTIKLGAPSIFDAAP